VSPAAAAAFKAATINEPTTKPHLSSTRRLSRTKILALLIKYTRVLSTHKLTLAALEREREGEEENRPTHVSATCLTCRKICSREIAFRPAAPLCEREAAGRLLLHLFQLPLMKRKVVLPVVQWKPLNFERFYGRFIALSATRCLEWIFEKSLCSTFSLV
jgi:hypothetical protein